MARKFKHTLLIRVASSIAMLAIVIALLYFFGITLTAIVAGAIMTLEIVYLCFKKLSISQKTLALTYLLLIYMALYAINLISHMPNGFVAILSVYLIIILADTGAYLFGSLLKGPKLCPAISPAKTVSGAVFSIILPVIVYYVLMHFNLFVLPISVYQVAILAALATLGDLTESALKRYLNIKDFANSIPGHGGLIDRFDSAVFTFIYFAVIGSL